MTLLMLISPALALPPPSVGGRVEVAVARGDGSAVPAGGAVIEGELPVTERVRIGAELGAQVGGGVSGLVLPEVGLYFNPAWRRGPAVAGVAALGMSLSDQPVPVGLFGARVDFPLNERWGLRVQTDVLLDPTEGPVSVRLGVGPERLFRAPEPPTPVPPATVGFTPADARGWVEHPSCGWHPVQELLIRPGDLSPDTGLVLYAHGYLPARTTLAELADTHMARAPEQGALVLVGWPGDHVRVDGHPMTLDADGVVVVQAPLGSARVEFEGGGRSDTQVAGVADGYVTWVRSDRPEVLKINFDQGSATVDSANRRDLAIMAQRLGDWRFRVEGSASPEGDRDHNLELADQRAIAVRQLLLGAGLSPEQVELGTPVVQLYGEASALRAVLITPLAPIGSVEAAP